MMEVNERVVEYATVLGWLADIYPVSILDVGSGESAWSQMLAYCRFEVTDMDSMRGFLKSRKKDQLGKKYKLKTSLTYDITQYAPDVRYDFVCCVSTLEHIEAFNLAVDRMFGVLNQGGHLALTIPFHHTDYFWNIYEVSKPEKVAGICHQFSEEEVKKWLDRNRAILVEAGYYKAFTGKYWRGGERIKPEKVEKEQAQLACFLMKKM